MSIRKFLDAKHGRFIGRVYFLVILFIGNALIPIGAVSHFLKGSSPFVMYLGIIITVLSIAVLSTPYDLSQYKEDEKKEEQNI